MSNASAAEKQSNRPIVGDKAPLFHLPADGGAQVDLAALRGKQVVLYFYPKDDTPGCTVEAKEFRDLKAQFDASNAVIIGLSKDSPASHDKFKEKFCLPFTLASDTDGATCETYGVWVEKSMYGKKYMGIDRVTFLIGTDGVITHIWPKVKVEGHAQAVLDAIKGAKA
jgi:peroxiredoxin Q/BCP